MLFCWGTPGQTLINPAAGKVSEKNRDMNLGPAGGRGADSCRYLREDHKAPSSEITLNPFQVSPSVRGQTPQALSTGSTRHCRGMGRVQAEMAQGLLSMLTTLWGDSPTQNLCRSYFKYTQTQTNTIQAT